MRPWSSLTRPRGLFLPLVPARVRVARVVYLAAVIPEIGKTFMDQFRSAPDMYRPGFVGKDPTKDSDLARHFLFHDCGANVAEWAVSTLRFMFAKQSSHRDHAAAELARRAGILHFVQ